MSKPRVVLTHWVHDEVVHYLNSHCELIRNNSREAMPRKTLLKEIAAAEAVMVFGKDMVDGEMMDAAPKLRIAAATTTQPKNVDIGACTKRGIWYTTVPDMRHTPASELAVGLLISVTRMLPEGDRFIRSGKFSGWRADHYGTGLSGKTLGIVGMGLLGQAIAKRLEGFELKLLYTDPNPLSKDREYALKLIRKSLDDLLASSDFVILSLPLLPETRGLINADTAWKMKKRAYLINMARGSVVEESAVVKALETGQLAGYAADVFAMEDEMFSDHPESIHPALVKNSFHTVFTPHIGSAVDDVRRNITLDAAQNILEALAGQRPHGAANQPEVSFGTASEPFF